MIVTFHAKGMTVHTESEGQVWRNKHSLDKGSSDWLLKKHYKDRVWDAECVSVSNTAWTHMLGMNGEVDFSKGDWTLIEPPKSEPPKTVRNIADTGYAECKLCGTAGRLARKEQKNEPDALYCPTCFIWIVEPKREEDSVSV